VTPVQRITLTCRQTGEHASRLIGWLEQDQAYALQHRGLRDEIDGAVGRLADIRHAVDLPPSIGIVGAPGAGKTELVVGLASLRQQGLVAEFSGGQIDLNVIDAVLPPAGHQGIGLVLRFTGIDGPVPPKGLPVRVLLLSQTDVVRILARGYHTYFPAAHRVPPTAARIAQAFGIAERALIAQSVVGLSARDILDLRDHLHGFYPESMTLRTLAAAGYWEQLGELAAHLPDVERRRLLALLWNEDPGLSRLFGRLCDGLERLGHAHDVFAPIEALAIRERGTGWVVPHPRTIVAAETLQTLGQGIDEKLRVAGRYGQIVEVERSVLAGLAAELPMRLAAPQLAALKPAQILEFPSPPPLVDFDASELGQQKLAKIAALFAHIKAIYLLERACQRHDITCLVVCVNPLAADTDDIAPAIAEWIETTQGSEPHLRERLHTGLFVVGTKLDQLGLSGGQPSRGFQATDDSTLRDAAQRWGDRLGAKLATDLGADQEWPLEWTPGRAFHNIYLFQRPTEGGGMATDSMATDKTASDGGGSITPSRHMLSSIRLDAEAVLKSPQLARHIENPVAVWSAATVAPDGGIGHLLAGLTPTAQPASKHRQLNSQLVDLRRRLRSRLLRLHLSNDASQIGEWRRQLAIVAQGRLQRVAQSDRMHLLRQGLGTSEAELAVLYFGVLPGGPRSAAVAGGTAGDQGAAGSNAGRRPLRLDAAQCERLAVVTVEYWLQSIRQVARSTRFCRSVGLTQPILQHIVDEISLGALRLGVAAHLTETFHRAAHAPTERALGEPYFAAVAARVIGRYIERLTLRGEDGRREGAGISRSWQGFEQVGGRLAETAQNRGLLTPVAAGPGRTGATVDASQARAWGAVVVRDNSQRDNSQRDNSQEARTAPTGGAEAGNAMSNVTLNVTSNSVVNAAVRDQTLAWAHAYALLVEANIAAAAHMTGGADRDRELGELLAGFLASPLEVDP
jgi:hypothetical protein